MFLLNTWTQDEWTRMRRMSGPACAGCTVLLHLFLLGCPKVLWWVTCAPVYKYNCCYLQFADKLEFSFRTYSFPCVIWVYTLRMLHSLKFRMHSTVMQFLYEQLYRVRNRMNGSVTLSPIFSRIEPAIFTKVTYSKVQSLHMGLKTRLCSA